MDDEFGPDPEGVFYELAEDGTYAPCILIDPADAADTARRFVEHMPPDVLAELVRELTKGAES